MSDPWEDHAAWWQREFTDGADLEYVEQILPLLAQHLPERGRMVDIGCGDGQVARLAAQRHGLQVVGIDGAAAQLTVARERAGGPAYCRGSATSLCVRDASVDVAVACLVIEHVGDLDAALAEVARVLVSGGRLLLVLNHPLLQTPGSGWIDDQVLDPPEQYWRVGPYLSEGSTVEQVDKGVFIQFFHRPLSRYVNTAADLGMHLVRMEEPAPPPGFLSEAEEYTEAASIPRLLFLRFERH